MAAICRLGLVEGSSATTHEGPFTVAILCKKIRRDQRNIVEFIACLRLWTCCRSPLKV